tara:strand:- start:525 stop:1685 length:1161 start_codon:yes stop_codon:yes gene_type:complete
MNVVIIVILCIVILSIIWGIIIKAKNFLGKYTKFLLVLAFVVMVVIGIVWSNKSNYESTLSSAANERTILCSDGSTVTCETGADDCEDFSLKFCPEDINLHKCNNEKTFTCNDNDPTCYDNSPTYCDKDERNKNTPVDDSPSSDEDIVSHVCSDGTVFTCNSSEFGCENDSPIYCSQPTNINDEPEEILKPTSQFIPESTSYKCKTGKEFNCFNGTAGCFPNSIVYCKGGDNWCEFKGGKTLGNGMCSFSDWKTCIEKGECLTDPAEAHPEWYDMTKANSDYDREKVIANGAEDAMDVVDECLMSNTTANKNPRCNIKHGKYKGKIGVCVYDGMDVQECQPVGQGCNAAIPNYCNPVLENPMTGEVKNVNPMCFSNNGKVTLQCIT